MSLIKQLTLDAMKHLMRLISDDQQMSEDTLVNINNDYVKALTKGKQVIEYTGILVPCRCGKEGKLRFPFIDQTKRPDPQMHISCDECHERTWAGEN